MRVSRGGGKEIYLEQEEDNKLNPVFQREKCLALRPSQCLEKDGQSCPITFLGRWAVKSQPLQCTRTNYGDSKSQLEWSKWPFHGIKGGLGESPNSHTTVLLDLFPQRLPFPSAVHLSKHFSLLCSAQWLSEQRCRTGRHAGRQQPLIARLLWGWTWSFSELLSWWDSCNCL